MRFIWMLVMLLFVAGSFAVSSGCGPSHMSENAASNIPEDETYDDQLETEGFEDADDEDEGDDDDDDE